MIEFKVTRRNPVTKERYDEYLFFAGHEQANDWAAKQNQKQKLSVVALEEVADHNHSENKYEYS